MATAQRTTGTPTTEIFHFDMPAEAPVCLRIANPAVSGHRVTAADVQFDGSELLAESDFTQSFAGLTTSATLQPGVHTFEVRVRSKPGTRLEIRVEVAGPVIDRIAPVTGDTGTTVSLQGEGFFGPLTVHSQDVELLGATAVTPLVATATTVASMPIGSLTLTTPFGSATSAQGFVPTTPRGAVPFYPYAEFAIDEAPGCVAASRLRVLQDGSRAAFVVDFHRPPPTNVEVRVSIDNDNRPATTEHSLVVSRTLTELRATGAPDVLGGVDWDTAVVAASFASLELNDPEKLGRMFLRVAVTSDCGAAVYPSGFSTDRDAWFEVNSVFAPGLVLIDADDPAAVAARHGLRFLASDPDSTISVLGLPSDGRLRDVVIALGRDATVRGVTLDPVLYPASHLPASPFCQGPGPVFESTNTAPMPTRGQWPLARIGADPHPSPLAGLRITVAVLDSGVDPHPDIAPNLVGGVDVLLFGDGRTIDLDPSGGHGTGVASLIAAVQGNGGIVGVAPGASILPVRVLNAFSLTDGFGLFRAFGAVMRLRATTVPSIQVVNVSMAEFLDTLFVVAGVLTALADSASLGINFIVRGLIISQILHDRAGALVRTGVALVVSSGNFGDWFVVGAAGMQYPANVEGAFAVAEVDSNGASVPASMGARPGQHIALSAPASFAGPTGLVGGSIAAASTGGLALPVGAFLCFNGTSFAAPLVSGAIASLLAPPPPRAPLALTGAAAARILVDTATPLPFPASRVGAGELNLRLASNPRREFTWNFDFDSTSGLIDDFAFLPGMGDYALRGGGFVVERIAAPLESPTTVVTFATTRSWLVGLGNTGLLALGTGSATEVRRADGAVVGTLAGQSFRPAVSPFDFAGVALVASSNAAGGVRLRRADTYAAGPDVANIAAPAGQTFLGAHWAGVPAFPGLANEPYVLALRTQSEVRYFRVPANVNACAQDPAACPAQIGTSDVSAVGPIIDWALTTGTLGPTSYFVTGTNSIFVASIGGQAQPVAAATTQRYVAIAANPRLEAVYAVDEQNSRFVMMRGTEVIGVDTTRTEYPEYRAGTPIRVSPAGNYAYIRGSVATTDWNTGRSIHRAVFVGLLAP